MAAVLYCEGIYLPVQFSARAKSTEQRRVDGAISILRAHVSRRVRWKTERSRRASIIRLFDGARGRILLVLVLLLIPHYGSASKRAMVRATNARLRVEMALPCHRDASHPKKKRARFVLYVNASRINVTNERTQLGTTRREWRRKNERELNTSECR